MIEHLKNILIKQYYLHKRLRFSRIFIFFEIIWKNIKEILKTLLALQLQHYKVIMPMEILIEIDSRPTGKHLELSQIKKKLKELLKIL